MSLPRFTLRTALLAFSGATLLAVILTKGASAWAWAFGLAIGAASVVAALVVHALFYLGFVLLGRLLGVEEIIARTSQGAVVRSAPGAAAQVESLPTTEAQA